MRGKAGLLKLGLLGAMLMVFSTSHAGAIKDDCTFNGQKLYGKVQVVDSFPDFKVKVISSSFADLKVKTVSSFANDCGKWQFVDSFPDFKVQFVNSFPDFTIKFVDSFPGLK